MTSESKRTWSGYPATPRSQPPPTPSGQYGMETPYLPRPHGISGYQTTGTGGGAFNQSYGGIPKTAIPSFSSGYNRQFHATPDEEIIESDFDNESYAQPKNLFSEPYSANYDEDKYYSDLGTYRTIFPETGDKYDPTYQDMSEHIRNIELKTQAQTRVIPTSRVGSVGDENGTWGSFSVSGMSDISDVSMENIPPVFPNTPIVVNTSNSGSGVHPGHATFTQSGHHHVSSTITPTQAYKLKNQYVDPILSGMPPPPQPTTPLTGIPTPRLVTSQGIPFRPTVPIPQRPQS